MSTWLKSKNAKTWKDDEGGMSDMAVAVQKSVLLIVFISEAFFTSETCKREVEYGANMNKKMIVIKLEPDLKLSSKGSLGWRLASKLNFAFKKNYKLNMLPCDKESWMQKMVDDYFFLGNNDRRAVIGGLAVVNHFLLHTVHVPKISLFLHVKQMTLICLELMFSR